VTAPGAVPRIGGATRLFAVLGDPVAQVRAPGLLNPLFAALGVDAVLVPVHVPPAGVGPLLRALRAVRNLDGLLVTVPHKMAVRRHVDTASPAAALLGSVNAVRRAPDGGWHGDTFDGAGFVAGLRAAGHDPAGRRVALAGAGGAGTAIAAALLDAGAAHVSVGDPDPARLARLRRRLAPGRPGRLRCAGPVPDLTGAHLAVNATPLGLRPDDPLPFDPAALPPDAVVADIVMRPAETPLLRAAAARGLAAHPGLPMLEQQIPLYRAFFGLPGG
jgi:shikimate dehydrogenase